MWVLILFLGACFLVIFGLKILETGMFLTRCEKCKKYFTFHLEEDTEDISGRPVVHIWRALRCFNPRCRHTQVLTGIVVKSEPAS